MARAAPRAGRAGWRVARPRSRRRGAVRARDAIEAYDCVARVDDDGRARDVYAVMDVDGDRAVVRALTRSASETNVWMDDGAGVDEVVRTRALRRLESAYGQRKASRRDDPHGERAVDAWTLETADGARDDVDDVLH